MNQPQIDVSTTPLHRVARPAPAGALATVLTLAMSAAAHGLVPMTFEANRGQAPAEVRYLARGAGYGLFLRDDAVLLAFGARHPDRAASWNAAMLRLDLVNGDWSRGPVAGNPLAGHVNYLQGPETAWRAAVPTFESVAYEDVYPGIDLVLYGNDSRLEYDFVVAPGADPADIRIAFDGATGLELNANGELLVATPAGTVRQSAPFAYQDIGGRRLEIASAYRVDDGRVGFTLGDYDAQRPLVIDPVLAWSTFHGGATGYEWATDVVVDADGFVYVAGYTFDTATPTTAGAWDTTFAGMTGCAPGQDPGATPPPGTEGTCISDAFVAKLTPDGSALVYSTYLGGGASDRAMALAVDSAGHAYVTGGTNSADFPTTAGAPGTCTGGGFRDIGLGLMVLADAFVTKLAPDGASLVYSTCVGGTDNEEAFGIEVDASGSAYLTGHTFSTDLPTTPGAFDDDLNGPGPDPNPCGPAPLTECFSDAFAVKLDPAGTAIDWATYIGGSGLELNFGMTVDAEGAVYLVGDTTSIEGDFPITPGVVGPTHNHDPLVAPCDATTPIGVADCVDAYVVKIAPGGSSLAYATFLGGTEHEHANGIVVRLGEAFVAGHTLSSDFPTTAGAFDDTVQGEDAFVARLTPSGDALVYSTIVGGSAWEFGSDLAVDPSSGTAMLIGLSGSDDFPATADAFDPTFNGAAPCNRGEPPLCLDGFLAFVSGDGASLPYATYFGGAEPDVIDAVATRDGKAYVSGITFAPDFPVTLGASQPLYGGPGGYSDSFVAGFEDFDLPCFGLGAAFEDTFEPAAATPAWDVVRDPLGHLSGAGTGLGGSTSGLEVAIDHNPPAAIDREHFILDKLSEPVGAYCAEFLFAPNAAEIAGRVKIHATRGIAPGGSGPTRLTRLILRENPGGDPAYQLSLSVNDDSGAWVDLPWVGLEDGETRVTVAWNRGSGGADGAAALYLDGELVAAASDLDNDDRGLVHQAVGNLGLFKASTSGVLGWDAYGSFGR